MISKLSENGSAGYVLANGSMTSNTNSDGAIRQKIMENDLVDCMIALPGQLFYTTPIPACIWILSKKKKRPNETLFIDARSLGQIDEATKTRYLSKNEISQLAQTYHKWRNQDGYSDTLGFSASRTTGDIERSGYVLAPGRYVGNKKLETDDTLFEDKMIALYSDYSEQRKESVELDIKVIASLSALGFEL